MNGESKISEIVENLEKSYIGETDWEVRENANKNLSYSNFIDYVYDKIMKSNGVLTRYFPTEAVKMYKEGDIHIHKLPHSLYIPYCVGWSIPKILKLGLRTPTIYSHPAKHLDTAISHLVNFFFLAAQEFTGAMAASAIDLYMAPYIRKDSLEEHQIKQAVQRLLFELNYPSRMGYQSVFSNVTLILDTVESFLESDAYIGGERVGKLRDYLDEAILFAKLMTEEYIKGDARGQPFTFPIPTLMITKSFDWNGTRWGELTDLIFEALARRGTFYLLNGYVTNVEAIYSMCCRLTIDTSKLQIVPEYEEEFVSKIKKTSHGIWAIPDATGSIGVITINLPRLAVMSNGDDDKFFELLEDRLSKAREVLLRMRKRYERNLRMGLMPITKVYLNNFSYHFNTFGVVGLPEAAANFMDTDLWIEPDNNRIKMAVNWMRDVVRFINKVAEEYEKEDGYLYNVEETPAESTAYRLAMKDYKLFKEEIELGEVFIPTEDGIPFYSNSIIPYYADLPIDKRAEFEGMVHKEFTGGVMMHLFFYETPDPSSLKKLVRRIATETEVVYFSITPAISVCTNCGWHSVGVFERCPKCGSEKIDIWSRIVGYYRPIRTWNIGKKAEFRSRVHYGIEKRRRIREMIERAKI